MSEIFVLTITHGPRATQESFFYKDVDKARGQWQELDEKNPGEAWLEDDYGNVGCIYGDVHSVRLAGMEKSIALQGEQALINARAQAKLQNQMVSDPVIKLGGQHMGQVHQFPPHR